jgi:hypothetical protein
MEHAYTIAAYYWPGYHDEPRWRPFFKGTEGEWEIVRQARPGFAGHYQPRVPLWGYENEADPRAMEKKIAAAADHGVNTFIFDWYWYENQPFQEECLNQSFLKARNNDRLSFYLMWANHEASTLWNIEQSHKYVPIWPGLADRRTFDTVVDRVIERYLHHPSYYKIDGCPVFSIYELGTLTQGLGGVAATRDALDSFREKVRAAGFPGLHLQAILWQIGACPSMVPGDKTATRANTVTQLGFDSLTFYQWAHYVKPCGQYRDWAAQAMAGAEAMRREFPQPVFPHVSIGWDTNARFKTFRDDVVQNSTPEAFAECLRWAKDWVDREGLRPRLITINSWNEWAESSYLEPDQKFGLGYLEAVKSVFGGAHK